MKIELTVTIEIDEDDPEQTSHLTEMIETLGKINGVGTDVETIGGDISQDEGDETKSLEELLDELPDDEHRYVFRALIQESGHSRRVIHRKATQIDGSPFNNFDPDNQTPEREEVGRILWALEDRGYAKHEGNRWYPVSEKFTHSAAAVSW